MLSSLKQHDKKQQLPTADELYLLEKNIIFSDDEKESGSPLPKNALDTD
jgi:hypothetical protein